MRSCACTWSTSQRRRNTRPTSTSVRREARRLRAHWLDRFGAGGARVVASGQRDGDRLVIVFPYAEGAFGDTLTRERESNGWSLLIEAQAPDGKWSTFARYVLRCRH
jgi:hypothetical protein